MSGVGSTGDSSGRRAVEGEGALRRRRECLSCAERFTTYETVELRMPSIVKTNGNREEFEEAKNRKGGEGPKSISIFIFENTASSTEEGETREMK